jgi:predicted DNA-binding transcriptional regulator AlpA
VTLVTVVTVESRPFVSLTMTGGCRMPSDELLTIPQVLAELGGDKPLARGTFYRWRAVGKAPRSIKLPNGTIRVRRSALERFLMTCEEPA